MPKRRTVKRAFFGPQLVKNCQAVGGHLVQTGTGFGSPGQTHELVPAIAIGSVATILATFTGLEFIGDARMVMFTGGEVLLIVSTSETVSGSVITVRA